MHKKPLLARFWIGLTLLAVATTGAVYSISTSHTEQSPAPKSPQPEVPPTETPTAPADVNPESFPEVVARVNGKDISKKELLDRAVAIQSQLQQKMPNQSGFYRKVLDELIGAELLFMKSQEKGFKSTEEEVQERLTALRSQFNDEAEFTEALGQQGFTLEQMMSGIRQNISIQKLIEAEIVPSVEVTEPQKKEFYEGNKEQMKQDEQVKVSHILIMVDKSAAPEAKEEARARAKSLRDRIVAGEDFAELARTNSNDPQSAGQGGQLPWLTRGKTVPAFEQAAFSLKAGEVSELVETPYGFHILKVADHRPAGVLAYEEVEPKIEEFLTDKAVREKINYEIAMLRENARVEIFI